MTNAAVEMAPSRLLAAEIRAELARRGISNRRFALQMGVNYMWVNRRIGMSADVDLTFEDLNKIASTLGVPATKVMRDAHLLPHLDSNQEPSDSENEQPGLFELDGEAA